MELIKKINEKVPAMESKIMKNLLALKAQLNEFEHITNEDFDIESQREQKKKLENDIENNDNALEILSGMTRLIKNFQNQNKTTSTQSHDENYDESDESSLTDDESDESSFTDDESDSWYP